MKRHAKTVALALASLMGLAGCASAQASKPPVCDGRHQRAVNIHASVLGEVPPAIANASQPARPAAPPPQNNAQAKPANVSAAGPGPLWFPSC